MANSRGKPATGARGASLNNPNAKHDTVEQYERTLTLVAELYNRGWTQEQIRGRLRSDLGVCVSQPQISKYIKELHRRWREDSAWEREDHVARKVKQLEDIRRECWIAYEMSKKRERTVNKEFALTRRLKEKAEAHDKERDGAAELSTTQKKFKLLKVQVRELQRLPADRFLTIVLTTIELECELLGLYAPKELKLDASGGGKKVLDWSVRVKSLPAPRDLENELDRVKDEITEGEILETKPPRGKQ